jgi:ATP-dependent exoDNAse (exonuclease V) beta subunit
VQGGRGLLDAREVREVFQWLEALERQDDDLVFAALLRGATVGLSDPGLYAIRRGYGLELRNFATKDDFLPARGRNALSSICHGFRFDAAKAIEAMEKAAGQPLEANVRAALRRDDVRLRFFAEAWTAAASRFGLVPLSDVVEQIVVATGYEAVLWSRADGLQALANLRSFQDLVRAAEVGRSPADAVREVERIASQGEDPAAAGFSLQPGAAVTVTVVHQAKGREWDTVVVPDLHRVKVKGRVAGCDLQRLVRREGRAWERRFLPASLLENPKDLLGTSGGVGAKVLAAATRGAERAELRRLLYVACTRARKRLVLTASWPDEEAFVKLAKLAKKGELGLSRSRSWFDDVVFGLQLQLGKDGRPVPGDGVWKAGRDFRWVAPEGKGFGDVEAPLSAPAKVDPAVIRFASQGVPPEPLTIVNPSCAEATGPVPAPAISRPAKPPPAWGDSPFASANEQGSAFHRTMQFWSYTGECTDAVIEHAIKDVVGEWRLTERVARIRQVLDAQATCQPALLAELRDASARGELFHEVSVGYLRDDGVWVEGVIDLLYRDAAGDWHVVDYKTDRVADDTALHAKFEEYYPQVRAYADALNGQLPGGAVVKTIRLWMIGAGCVGSWTACPSHA